MSAQLTILLLILLSFLPAIGYLAWVRKTERYQEEGWWSLLKAFAFGAIVSTLVAGILEFAFKNLYSLLLQPELPILPKSSFSAFLVLVLVGAPVIEEGMKGLGVWGMRKQLRFVADGLVFGAAVGFGFAFVENTLYGIKFYGEAGLTVAVGTLLVRAVSSTLLHGSATAMTGYGVAENRLHEGRGHILLGYYSLAVLMHASFNALVTLPQWFPSPWGKVVGYHLLTLLALIVATTYAIAAFSHIRKRVAELQTQPVRSWGGSA